MYDLAIPGQVIVTSTKSTFNSITINWQPLLDENDEDYEVRIKFSYKNRLHGTTEGVHKVLGLWWTLGNLRSGLVVQVELSAFNKMGLAGPITNVHAQTRCLG